MAILVFTWYKIGRLENCGVKHPQLSSILRMTLTIRLSLLYIICYNDLLTGFPFMHFSFPIIISLGLPLSKSANESITLAIMLGSLLALYYSLFIILFTYTKMR